jgi:ATP-binding cassette subfamily B (MDR/TAP) protein 1
MAIFGKPKASPPSASIATDAIEQNIQVLENATGEKDRVAESPQSEEKKDDLDEKAKKKPTASLGNYFVRVTELQNIKCA